MKKSLRRPNKGERERAVPLKGVKGINTEAFLTRNAQTGQVVSKKVEGQEMLTKVKEYKPVVIKGYKYAF